MAIDRDRALARTFAPLTFTVERGRLRAFATAIGETDPVYLHVEDAKRAGHPDLPVPPTFFFSMELEVPDPFGYLADLGVDLRRVLHGEQAFIYHKMAYAGDTLVLRSRIADAYSKRGGALEFLVKKTEITRAGQPVAESTATVVVRQLDGGA
jgi:N-terminal half of MaoC dehydratase